MSKRILVTGGAGFIGSHLTRLLILQGHEVTVVDNLSMGQRSNVPEGAQFIEADIQDGERMVQVLRANRIERVCHLAARVSIRASTSGFCEDAETNIMGTLRLLWAIGQTEVSKIVFASSMAIYSDAPTAAPLGENSAAEPISPYGVSKLAGEKFIANIMSLSGRSYTVLRLFNTYGAGQTFTPYVGVITIFATRLLQGASPTIFGDGEQIRDFVWVGDVARAFRSAVESDGPSGIFNIGSGQPRSVNEVARMLQARINPGVPLAWAEACPGEIRNSVADISRARNALSYAPVGTLESKLDDVIDTVRLRVESQRPSLAAGNR